MTIGLPRALMYHYYYPFWRSMWQKLGVDVIVSEPTCKSLVQPGINASVAEICLPIKIFNGHVIDLISKKVDYIFVPRLISVEKKFWCCPKYIGLPELVENSVLSLDNPANSKFISVDISVHNEDITNLACYLPLCKTLGIPKRQLKEAIKAAKQELASFRQIQEEGFSIDEADKIFYDKIPREKLKCQKHRVTIGVLGYVYNIYDPFISMNIIEKMRRMEVNVITFDMLKPEALTKYRNKKDKPLYWTFTDKLYQAAHYMLKDLQVDGLMHVTAFGCGPDSILGKKIEVDFEKWQKPFMTLRVDEHTGENHLQTRIEAFCDMLKRKLQSSNPRKVMEAIPNLKGGGYN